MFTYVGKNQVTIKFKGTYNIILTIDCRNACCIRLKMFANILNIQTTS